MLKKLKLKAVLKSVTNGVLDVATLGAAGTIRDNIQSREAGIGNVDWLRMVTAIVVGAAVIAFIFGKLSRENLEFVVNLLE